MPRVAVYLSSNCYPPNEDDALLLDALGEHGAVASPVIWNAPPNGSFDAGIIRSTWDYAFHPHEFQEWLRRTDADATLFNPLPTLLWSMDKRYLLELERDGAPMIPTECIEAPTRDAVVAAARDRGWHDLVVKSVVSAGGRQIARASANDPGSIDAALAHVHTERPVLVQPFMPDIRTGEYSLIFLGDNYSHSVLKVPGPDTYLSQEHYGGSVAGAEPPARAIEIAGRALASTPHPWLYARVDVMVDETLGPLVVELELLEPDLFLRYEPGSEGVLARALLGAL